MQDIESKDRQAKIARMSVVRLETLEGRQLLAASLAGDVLKIVGGEASDVIRIVDDKTMPGKLLVQINKGRPAVFDRTAVKTIVVDGRGGNDIVAGKFTAGSITGRTLRMSTKLGTDKLAIMGSAGSLSGMMAIANRGYSTFSTKLLRWRAIEGFDPVVWSSAKTAEGIITVAATVTAATTANDTPRNGEPSGMTQTPWNGTGWRVMQNIQAEDYDKGGEGVAYHDTSSSNFGAVYRRTEAVDLAAASDKGGGYAVTWTRAGEWLEYTINVSATGYYTLAMRLASAGDGARMHVEVDGAQLGDAIEVPNTGGWQSWRTLMRQGVYLTAGTHVVRVAFDQDSTARYSASLNWFYFVPVAPNAPSGLVASSSSTSRVTLSWVDNSMDEVGFEVIRRRNLEESWVKIAQVPADTTVYNDDAVEAGTGYEYAVRATGSMWASAYAAAAQAKTWSLSIETPAAPAAMGLSDTTAMVTWLDRSDNEGGFTVERRTVGGEWQLAGMVSANVERFMDSGLAAGTKYEYRVIATNDGGMSAPTAAVSALTAVVLRPGTGWTGPTPQPPAAGTPGQVGYDAKAIARWDVVPYQTFNGDFAIGIPAFHMNGIDRVEFSVNNGPWVAVREMTLNPASNVMEYWALLRASAFAQDGQIEVRAVAWPKVGEARVLDSLQLFASPSGSLVGSTVYVSCSGSDSNSGTRQSPLATIARAIDVVSLEGGEIVLLEPGSYEAPNRGVLRNNTRWMTIRADEGLAKESVIITRQSRGLMEAQVNRLKWQGLTFDFTKIIGNVAWNRETWYDRVVWTDDPSRFLALPDSSLSPYHTGGSYYVTESEARNVFYVFVSAALTRNVLIDMYYGDAIQQTLMAINTTVTGGIGDAHPHHTDLIQYWGDVENIIVYGVKAQNLKSIQGIFYNTNVVGAVLRDSVFTDLDIQHVPWPGNAGGPAFSMLQGKLDHVLFTNIRLPWQRFFMNTDATGLGGYQKFEVIGAPVVLRSFLLHYRDFDNYQTWLPPGVIAEGLMRAPVAP